MSCFTHRLGTFFTHSPLLFVRGGTRVDGVEDDRRLGSAGSFCVDCVSSREVFPIPVQEFGIS